jgi:uncharacterized membrane protein
LSTAVAAPSASNAAVSTRRPWAARTLHLSWAGVVGALIGFVFALTPSLLPRPGLYLGLIGGIGAVTGYGIGVFVRWLAHKVHVPSPSEHHKQVAWRSLIWATPVIIVAALVAAGIWQWQTDALVGEDRSSVGAFVAAVVAFVVFFGILYVARGVRWCYRKLDHLLARFLPSWLAAVIGVIVVVLLGYWLAAGLLFNGFVKLADNIYAGTNAKTAEGVTQPQTPERSGSPASLAAWETLGVQGRTFVGTGPTPAQLESFSGQPALQPIRVYVGLDTAPTAQQRANLAVQELVRTGAFDRKVLVVAGATGTGWLEPEAVDSIEYMWNGDTAIATIQYSYLPSWISFLVDKERAADAGKAMFDAVRAKWLTLPADQRPKLIAYGLSLGSFAAQSAFATAGDISTQTDGALFIGTPNFTQPWGDITRLRDSGSPEWQPVYDAGKTVRFGSQPGDPDKLPGLWSSPHVLYMQHASDPVVWWSPKLLTRQPDWLSEPRGPDVSPVMRWYPVVTFFQVTVDQFFGVTVPQGHGHNYASEMAASWAYVVPPPGWTADQTARLQALINSHP